MRAIPGMTVINPERTRLQARATELRATIRRSGKDSEAGKAAQQELMQLEGKLTEAFRTESKLNMNAFRAEVDKKLKGAGIKLDKKANQRLHGEVGVLSTKDSKIPVIVLPTNEELMIAKDTVKVLSK